MSGTLHFSSDLSSSRTKLPIVDLIFKKCLNQNYNYKQLRILRIIDFCFILDSLTIKCKQCIKINSLVVW